MLIAISRSPLYQIQRLDLNMRPVKINSVIGMMQNKSSKIAAAVLAASLSIGPVLAAGATTNSAHSVELSGLRRPDASKNVTTKVSIYLRKGSGVSIAEFNSLKNSALLLYNGNTEHVKLRNGKVVVGNISIGNPHGEYDISLWGINKANPFAQTPLSGSSPSWWYSMQVYVKGQSISVLHEPLKQYPSSTPWVTVSAPGNNQAVYLTVSKVHAPKSSAAPTTTVPPSTTSTTTVPSSTTTTAPQ